MQTNFPLSESHSAERLLLESQNEDESVSNCWWSTSHVPFLFCFALSKYTSAVERLDVFIGGALTCSCIFILCIMIQTIKLRYITFYHCSHILLSVTSLVLPPAGSITINGINDAKSFRRYHGRFHSQRCPAIGNVFLPLDHHSAPAIVAARHKTYCSGLG